MTTEKEGDILVLNDVDENDPFFGAVCVWGEMRYLPGPLVYRELKGTKLRVIK